MLLVGCFIAAMLFVLAITEYETEDEEKEMEIDRRVWINYLADRDRKQARHSARSRYSVSGVQK